MADSSSSSSSPLKRARVDASSSSNTNEKLCIDTIRVLKADMVEKANSGHPGAPMGCAPIAHCLYGSIMKFSSSNPKWYDRDRFVLSNGHACALLYAMLHLTKYKVSLDDLKSFRKFGSITPGHPENIMTPGVEVSTGPLGQGISNAVGLAMAERHLAATYNRDDLNIVDHYTYVICGDGCLQEGISSEACSLAGHLGLGKLIVCYDDNHVTIDGDTALSFTEDVNKRYESYGWHVQTVDDVNDINKLLAAIDAAKAETNKPSIIKIRTIIGQGSQKEGTGHVHGAPLGASDLAHVKTHFGFDPTQSFVIPTAVSDYYDAKSEQGRQDEQKWNSLFQAYSKKYPDLANEFKRRMEGELPSDWTNGLPTYTDDGKAVATRNRSEEVLNVLAKNLVDIMGGSADLTPSNLTALKCSGDFQKSTPAGRYIRFGVREHAMAAISNGLFAHGGFRPFCATFMNFAGYAMGSIRVSALSKFGVIYIMTHDSIGLGEDGPTHQPIEMLEVLRSTPNLLTLRPCDGNETVGAYMVAIKESETPSFLSLSRQGVPTIKGSSAEKVAHGGYVIHQTSDKPALLLIATGTEVSLAITVAEELKKSDGIDVTVVSMPCTELFDKQSLEYQSQILPDNVPIMSIEASGTNGWNKYAHATFGMTTFGASAPASDLFKHFGFTTSNLTLRARDVISFYKTNPIPSKVHYPRFASASSH